MDEAINGDFGVNEAADEFLKRFMPADAPNGPSKESDGNTPSDQGEENEANETETETEQDAQTEPSEDGEDEGSETGEKKYADDEAYTKVKVGEDEHEVALKDLKRLWGQEAALTNRSKEVADTRKKLDDTLAQNVAASNALLQRAQARWEPYSKIDFLLAARDLTPEEYTALKKDAQSAYEDVQFLEQHVGTFMDHIRQEQQQTLVTRARDTLKELGDPEKGIPGWGEKLYDDIRGFAVSSGVPKETVDNLVDGWAIRLLHDAMLYRRGQQGQGKVLTQKVNKTPKKIVKTTTTPEASRSAQANDVDKAKARLQKSGSVDDAANLFMQRWNVQQD